jgi:hypothetical protein
MNMDIPSETRTLRDANRGWSAGSITSRFNYEQTVKTMFGNTTQNGRADSPAARLLLDVGEQEWKLLVINPQ